MRTATLLDTQALRNATHAALCQGQWGVARGLLDLLSRRHDLVVAFSDLDAYKAISGRALTGDFDALIRDRLELVNAVADRNRDRALAAIAADWSSAFA